MTTLSPAFLSPVQLHARRRPRLLRDLSTCNLSVRLRTKPVIHRRAFCVAQEETLQPSPPHVPNDGDPPVNVNDAERKERARKARIEAERLELMAAKAKLEFERAELHAERKRLELDKLRNMREIQKSRDEAAGPAKPVAGANPYDKPEGTKKDPALTATVKIGSNPPKQVTADSLSDLLSSEFPRVSESDIDVIRRKLCGMDTFFVTEVDRSPFDERVVFRGNMRMDASALLDELEKRAEKEGIASRVRFFILVDPKETPNEADGMRRPVLVVLPAAAMPNQTTPFSAVFSVVVGLAALFTSFSYGIGVFGLTPDVISQIARGSTQEAALTLPISAGVMAISLIHDFGHRVMAQLRKVKLGLPFFIPSLQIGNFGIITPLESYPRFRKDLFDVAVAGPIAGIVTSLGAVIAGLVLSSGGNPAGWFPQIPTALFHASILIGAIADTILPAGIREQSTVALHPLFIVGYTGLLVNALNLMPIGRLDGGRIVQALYGRVVAGRTTATTLIVQALGSLLGNSPLLLFWGLVCVLLQRESDFPCLNEVLEPDSTRSAIGVTVLALALLVLIPYPDQIGDILGKL